MIKKMLSIMLALSLISTVHAQEFPPIPDYYSGVATDNGVVLPEGTIITVHSTDTGEQFASGKVLTSEGLYVLVIQFCKTSDPDCTPENTADGRATPDVPLTWKIDGVEAAYPAPGEIRSSKAGGGFHRDFNIEKSSSTPAPVTSTITTTTMEPVATTTVAASEGQEIRPPSAPSGGDPPETTTVIESSTPQVIPGEIQTQTTGDEPSGMHGAGDSELESVSGQPDRPYVLYIIILLFALIALTTILVVVGVAYYLLNRRKRASPPHS